MAWTAPQQDVSLKDYSTMRLGGTTAYLAEVASRDELSDAVYWAQRSGLPMMMIGGGSNIFWRDEGYDGLIVVNKIPGYKVTAGDELNYFITIGAGENWDSVVARTVADGLTGIECLSLIPGTAGATPVQNVGAYGQELADVLVSVEVYDRQTRNFANLPSEDCGFGYRTSRFKTTDKDRYFITGLTLHLTKGSAEPPYYAAVQRYLDEHQITKRDPQTLRDAVIAIRSAKLPDPAKVANNGSFFANPIVDKNTFAQLELTNPDMPHWQMDDGRIKLPAAWLIEQAGFKDFHDQPTGMATWPHQPLVFVNEAAKSTNDLLTFRQKILDAVQAKFGLSLHQEPELLP